MNAKKWIALGIVGILLTGCGQAASSGSASTQTEAVAEVSAAATTTSAAATTAVTAAAATSAAASSETPAADDTRESAASDLDPELPVRIGSLKGPTTMGLVNLMNDTDNGEADQNYEFTMASQPDEIVASIAGGDQDIALIPANLASVLYHKTDSGISVIDINTLGVLYCVTGDASVSSIRDFAGRTVLSTGQGATPEYAIEYLLDQNGITDCTLEFHSEATEIAALLKEDPRQIAVLPQPFATAACAQNDQLRSAFSLTDEWDKVADGKSRLLTGVTVVRNEFLEEHPAAVDAFLADHAASAAAINDDPTAGGELVAQYGILEKAAIATKAIPSCNIVCITGEDMKTALSGYLDVLAGQNPKSVGGSVPGDDFYYIGQ